MNIDSDDFSSIFINESTDQLDNLELDLLQLKQQPSKELINSIFRYIHTIKGGSMMLKYNKISTLAHSFENLFSKIRSDIINISDEIIETSFIIVDKIRLMIRDLETESAIDIESDIQLINSLITNKSNSNQLQNIFSSEIILSNFLPMEDNLEFLELAKKNNEYLTIVLINLLEQSFSNLNELVNKIDLLNNYILMKGVYSNFIDHDNNKFLPYCLLIKTKNDPIEFLNTYHIKVYKIQIINYPNSSNQNINNKKEESVFKVNLNLIDELINLASEAVVLRNQIIQSSNWDEESEQGIRIERLSQIITKFQNKLMKTRLQKLQSIYPRISRSIIDISKQLNKPVNFSFDGGEVELDKLIIEALVESLIHIIRNSIDHGIEPLTERIQLGKKPTGSINISAQIKGGNIHILIQDDGRGLDFSKIREKAIEKGLVSSENPHLLNNEELKKIIFLPGFTTKSEVSDLSGRGVGMNVVEKSLKKIGGKIFIDSDFGKGLSILTIIPQSLTVINSIIIKNNEKKYAIFQKYIIEIFLFKYDDLLNINNNLLYNLRENLIPVVQLTKILYPNISSKEMGSHLAIIKTEEAYFGMIFDSMVGIEEIVVKPLGEHFHNLDFYVGATTLGDGSAIMILDPEGLINKLNLINSSFESIHNKEIKNEELNKYLVFQIENDQYLCSTNYILKVEILEKEKIQRFQDNYYLEFNSNFIPFINALQEIKNDTIINYKALIISFNDKFYALLINNIIDIINEYTSLKKEVNSYQKYLTNYTIINSIITAEINIEILIKTFENNNEILRIE